MKLWHEKIIPALPYNLLNWQHRTCCALRGKSWGRNNSAVNYVFNHPYGKLVRYHLIVMKEMRDRGYSPSKKWMAPQYRGKNGSPVNHAVVVSDKPYPEHTITYLATCAISIENKINQANGTKKYRNEDIYRFFGWYEEFKQKLFDNS